MWDVARIAWAAASPATETKPEEEPVTPYTHPLGAQVARHLFHNCLRRHLVQKHCACVVLVTHRAGPLKYCDAVYQFADGALALAE